MHFINSFFSQFDDEKAWLSNFNEKLEKYQDALPCNQLLVYAIQADASRLLHTWSLPNNDRMDAYAASRHQSTAEPGEDVIGALSRITTFVKGLKQSGYCSPVLEKELGI